MYKGYEGLAAALLCVGLAVSGCSRTSEVYTTGMDQVICTAVEEENQTSSQENITEAETEQQYVCVCGAVESPGVYPIIENMRVFEVVELAGGFTEDADTRWVNQAEPVYDGQKICIYTLDETSQMERDSSLSETAADTSDGRVNINSASVELLMTLPGIGEAKAQSILQYRSEHGMFSSIEEIQNVPGIKRAVFDKIKEQITAGR